MDNDYIKTDFNGVTDRMKEASLQYRIAYHKAAQEFYQNADETIELEKEILVLASSVLKTLEDYQRVRDDLRERFTVSFNHTHYRDEPDTYIISVFGDDELNGELFVIEDNHYIVYQDGQIVDSIEPHALMVNVLKADAVNSLVNKKIRERSNGQD